MLSYDLSQTSFTLNSVPLKSKEAKKSSAKYLSIKNFTRKNSALHLDSPLATIKFQAYNSEGVRYTCSSMIHIGVL